MLKVLFLCRNHHVMNTKDLEHIDGLKHNIKRLIGLLEEKESELRQVRDEKKGLEFQLETYKNEIEVQKKRYDNLKAANILVANDGDREVTKSKINKIVREIDKCVALLNQ